ncbi:MAG TPA: fibronectin type III domain-containing protein [Nocardioides sp.]|nr:fibronectin type III domain-containing protein [Nocardioides sp.]
MKRSRFRAASLLAWLPVACLLGLAFVATPGASEAQTAGSLSISPTHFYGGQAVTFSGSIGRSGKHKIWLEFNMNRAGDGWTKIEGSTRYTDAQGHFKFQFPARGMLNISIRVASQGTATPDIKFQAIDQAVSVAVQPGGNLYGGGPCSAGFRPFKAYDTVSTEGFQVKVDATPDGEPPLKGRKVVLQKRTATNGWTKVAAGSLDKNGEASFPVTLSTTDETVYRAVLGSVTGGVNKIGWFPSFPTYVDPHQRPGTPAVALVTDHDPGAPNPTDLDVSGTPGGPLTDKVVVAWSPGAAPTDPLNAQDYAVADPGATVHVTDLVPAQSYGFAVFARSAAGICSTLAATDAEQTDPTPPVSNVHTTDVQPTSVSLAWDLPNIDPNLIDEMKVRRADGGSPPTSPAGGVQFDSPPFSGDTSFTDFTVAPSTTYSYSVFVKINGVWSVAASLASVTTGAQP